MTRLTSYSQMHSLLAEREPREFIPFVGQQNMAANILCTHLKHGNALLCPADTPNLLTMDLNETERAIDDATRRFRHPVITDPSMVYHV